MECLKSPVLRCDQVGAFKLWEVVARLGRDAKAEDGGWERVYCEVGKRRHRPKKTGGSGF